MSNSGSMRLNLSTYIFIAAIGLSVPAIAGKKNKKLVKQLKADIGYLASDELAGRRTGGDGEAKAANYIIKRYTDLGIPAYKGNYKHPFHFTYGREIGATTLIRFANKPAKLKDEAFPLPFSGSGSTPVSEIMPEITEQGNVWLVSLYTDKDQANDPHFDCDKHMYDYARNAQKSGAKGVVFYDRFGSKYEPAFNSQSDLETLDIPVVCVTYSGYRKYIQTVEDGTGRAALNTELKIDIKRTDRVGTNIAAYIDNGAKYTVVIGAHYDHLGFGEDGNSLYANAAKEHQIHHGADDNASGTAALMGVAKWLQHSKLHNYNYLFIHFSGEELGLFGSKAFVRDEKIDSAQVAYMLNMDMVGRLNDSTHALTIGGVGTSPEWGAVVDMAGKDFKVVIDSAGVGPSDHTSFYNAGIPVLFLFTGTHKDYHKPSDRAELINYDGEASVIEYAEAVMTNLDKKNTKPGYLLTRSMTMGKSKFKVTLGIMPDYSYQDGGVRVDGVTDGKAASKAGIKAGDIINQIGDVKIQGMQSYMEALGKFSPGDKTTVKVTRGGKPLSMPLEFMAK